jgi:hypothetical protein
VRDNEKRALLLTASCALAGSASTPEVENARLGETPVPAPRMHR